MAVYELRVQVQTDDERSFSLTGLKAGLAREANSWTAIQKVWVNDQLFMAGLDRLEDDEEFDREVD